MPKNLTPKNADKVFARILELNKQNPEFCKDLLKEINGLFNDLLADDFFGTEGQLDPRGDHRA